MESENYCTHVAIIHTLTVSLVQPWFFARVVSHCPENLFQPLLGRITSSMQRSRIHSRVGLEVHHLLQIYSGSRPISVSLIWKFNKGNQCTLPMFSEGRHRCSIFMSCILTPGGRLLLTGMPGLTQQRKHIRGKNVSISGEIISFCGSCNGLCFSVLSVWTPDCNN